MLVGGSEEGRMVISGSDPETFRAAIQQMLWERIPEEVSSDDKEFLLMTGMNTKWLKAQWANGKRVTSCNSFAGWVAREIGAKKGSILARGQLDLSLAEREVPYCWFWANTSEAILYNIHPQPGDFFCAPFPGQKFGLVSVVFDFDEYAQTWTVVQGGQGGPKAGKDYIRWKSGPFNRDKVTGWVDICVYIFEGGR